MRNAGRVVQLGKYQLVVELARGGMGVVHLAVMRGPAGFHKLVVVKELPARLSARPELVAMFLEEARIGARLNHPNIVQTYEVGHDDGRPYLAMEYLEGQSLRELLRASQTGSGSGPRLPLAVSLHVLIEALAGLAHAHELADFDGAKLDVVHRDVSPHNLFVTYEGTTKVLDFGLARATDSARVTDGVLRGKIAYMAPEQLRGEPVDLRADLFAVGVMLWEALAGRRMWRGLTELTVAHLLSAGDVPNVRDANRDVPEELARVCDRALAPDRSRRYASAREMQVDLEAYLRRIGKHATPRGVGILVGELFKEERARLRAVVDAQLRELRELGERASMVSLVDAGDRVAVLPEAEAFVATPLAAIAPRRAAESDELEIDVTVQMLESPPVVGGALRGASSLAPALTTDPPPRAPRRAWPAAAAIALLLIGGAMGFVVGGARSDLARRAQASAGAQDGVTLAVRASPVGARIWVDGRPVGESAYEARVVKDELPHVVRVEAEGYVPTIETVGFTRSVDLRVALQRETGDR